jgi:surface protein
MKRIFTILILFISHLLIGQNMELVFTVGTFSRTITLPLYGTVNATVNWGDGTKSDKYTTTGNKTHTYATQGTYTVTISGTLTQFGNGASGYSNSSKLIEVNSFGNIGLTSLSGAFYNATNLTSVPSSLPSTVTSLSYTFYGATTFNQDLSNWNVGNVTTMHNMFDGVTLRVDYYSNMLMKWSELSLQSNVLFDGGNSQYDPGRPESSRLDMIRNFNWSITDGGQNSDMILIYDTNVSSGMTISFYLGGHSLNATVSWGDGASQNYTTNTTCTHTYSNDGIYEVRISGTSIGFQFAENGGTDKLIRAESFGDIEWFKSFEHASNLVSAPAAIPTTLNNLSRFFYQAYDFNSDISCWDVSNVTDMSHMFEFAYAFNQDIGSWDVSNVTDMECMFQIARSFNQDVGRWDMRSVENIDLMFRGADSFNQDISDWDISNLNRLQAVFEGSDSFNQDLSGWDVSNITSMSGLFLGADSFNQDIGNWDVSNVTNMNAMFFDAKSFNQDIGNWDVSNVTDMRSMFYDAESFNQDIGNWNVSSVEKMTNLFLGAISFDQDISRWRVINTTDMSLMFHRVTLSTAYYDALLIAWSNLNLQDDVAFSAGNSKYSKGTAANARQSIIDNFNWSISDDGETSLLPVELTQFSPELIGEEVLLKWQTATEVNNYGFEIERASTTLCNHENNQWEKIGFVIGHGNSNSPKSYEFIDSNPPYAELEYRLKQIDTDGTFEYYDVSAKVDTRNITAVDNYSLPTEFALQQNYPNPFNPNTKIKYSIPEEGQVLIRVFDMSGGEITTLVNEQKEIGSYEVIFDTNSCNHNIASGVYLYKINCGNFSETKKMIFIK